MLDNHKKYLCSRNLGFHSYSDYTCHLIDKMIDQADQSSKNMTHIIQSVEETIDSMPICCQTTHHCLHHIDAHPDAIICDFHDPSKTRGFLAHESIDFQFVGPDRQPPTSTSLIENTLTWLQPSKQPTFLLVRQLDSLFTKA